MIEKKKANWLEALEGSIEPSGISRAQFQVNQQSELLEFKSQFNPKTTTPYLNTISRLNQKKVPGEEAVEKRIRAFVYWNALAIVLRANLKSNLGGHFSSFFSVETIYDVGFNYFWKLQGNSADLVFFQGHSSPGIYSRMFLLNQINSDHLDNFRSEINNSGLSSYPHPWLMPNFWQFPTVSMGIGPLLALYSSRFIKHLENRNLVKPNHNRKIWAVIGDAEMDEVESRGALSVANCCNLNNLVFIINCNLQGLDGPVRGNRKIIQELESVFIGAGWSVIKVIWGSDWDNLIEKDWRGLLLQRMNEISDGNFQSCCSCSGNQLRDCFFNTPDLKKIIAHLTDGEVKNLGTGGHDPLKIYNAFWKASHSNKPTAILIKTIKGFGVDGLQAANMSHQQKSLNVGQLKNIRDRLELPITDAEIIKVPYLSFSTSSIEFKYMVQKRMRLGGCQLRRRIRTKSFSITLPMPVHFQTTRASTTVGFLNILRSLIRVKSIGARIVPIVTDESRTFGLESLFREIGIWNAEGQNYTPEDNNKLLFYKESTTGQIMQEGINEAGATSCWMSVATSYSTNNTPMIPFYIFYSMFGFQRTGDLVWAAGDMRSRGFLIGGTSGRTTLSGEGLQHADGNSLLLSTVVPNCFSYNPSFISELAIIISSGLKELVSSQKDVFYYVTLTNEVYTQLELASSSSGGVVKGLYCLDKSTAPIAQLIGSGSVLIEVLKAKKTLEREWNVLTNVWSATSFTELSREDLLVTNWNSKHSKSHHRKSHLQVSVAEMIGPVVAVSDYSRLYAEQLRIAMQRNNKCYTILGTDGYGRSDTRENLRNFFEISSSWIVVATLRVLAKSGTTDLVSLGVAATKYKLTGSKSCPLFL